MTKKTDVLYIAGWNMPGYLPDTDPAVFETEGEATHYLISEIDLFWDEEYLAGDSREAADNRWMDVYSSLPYETAPYSVQNGDGSLAFWVTIVPRSDVPTYDSEGN